MRSVTILPFEFSMSHLSDFERHSNIPEGTILKAILANKTSGAWVKLEEGKLSMADFGQAFSKECSQQVRNLYSQYIKETFIIICIYSLKSVALL